MLRYLDGKSLKKWRGKTALLRVDLNIEPGQEENAYRLATIIPTINFLLKNRIKIVLLSHRGRPKNNSKFNPPAGGQNSKLSLRPIVKILENRLKKSIVFIPYKKFKQAKSIIQTSKNQIFCLENLRFWPGESQNSPVFAKKLAFLGDFYVNESFAASHRENASISVLPRFLPHYAGPWLKIELFHLDSVMRRPRHPITLVIGGEKAKDKLSVIEYFLPQADRILLGGGPANTFFKTLGMDIKNSIFDKEAISTIKKYIDNPKIVLPTDVRVDKDKILDIGPRTAEEFISIIKKSKTVIWNGPMGFFEKKGFEQGSYKLAKTVAQNRGFTLVGGGETTSLILKLGLEKKIKFISSGGGAMLDYLSGKKLPGLAALERASLSKSGKH